MEGHTDKSFRRARSLKTDTQFVPEVPLLRDYPEDVVGEVSWGVRTEVTMSQQHCWWQWRRGNTLNVNSRRRVMKLTYNHALEDEAAVKNYFLPFLSFPSSFFPSFSLSFFPYTNIVECLLCPRHCVQVNSVWCLSELAWKDVYDVLSNKHTIKINWKASFMDVLYDPTLVNIYI